MGYEREERKLGDTALSVVLHGEFREGTSCSGAPYTLDVFVTPRLGETVQISNIELRQKGAPQALVSMSSPELRDLKSATRERTVYLEFDHLMIPYEDCELTFDLIRGLGAPERVEFHLKKKYESRWTTTWWERMSSV